MYTCIVVEGKYIYSILFCSKSALTFLKYQVYLYDSEAIWQHNLSPIWKRTLVWLNYHIFVKRQRKTRIVEEPSHWKQLSINNQCKIGLTKPYKNVNFYHVKTIFCFLFIRHCGSGRTGDDRIHSIHRPHVHSRRGKSNKQAYMY